MTSTSLSGKVAIVTGGSRGIGAAIVLELARRGAKVAITFTSPSSESSTNNLIATVESLQNGSAAIGIRADLGNVESPEIIVKATLSAFSAKAAKDLQSDDGVKLIDIVVNNAGIAHEKHLGDITLGEYASVYDLHVRATLLMTQAVLPHLRAPGRIINIGSVGSRIGMAGRSLYCSSKAAIEGLTRCWAAELGPAGTTVNVVNPGPTETAMAAGATPAMVSFMESQTPMQNRLGTADDVAQIVAFLAEESSRWVTGQTISASGGFQMY
ncbi:hypothetical protein MMC07_003192 [Pseudocyphellaria aurata]|nr:hypothetical protein [Pseudocyphellaria aurata]